MRFFRHKPETLREPILFRVGCSACVYPGTYIASGGRNCALTSKWKRPSFLSSAGTGIVAVSDTS